MTASQSYALVQRFGTATDIRTAAHYLAYGRSAAVQALSARIVSRIPAALFSLTA